MLDDEIRIMRSNASTLQHELRVQDERIKDNKDKVKLNRQLPYLVANVVELIDPDEEDEGVEGALDDGSGQSDFTNRVKGCVVKTTSRQTMFLPIPGLVPVWLPFFFVCPEKRCEKQTYTAFQE